jgi:hypothetical protein
MNPALAAAETLRLRRPNTGVAPDCGIAEFAMPIVVVKPV